MLDPFAKSWLVMVEVGSDFPELFGPFTGADGRGRALDFTEHVARDERVFEVAVVPVHPPVAFEDGSFWERS